MLLSTWILLLTASNVIIIASHELVRFALIAIYVQSPCKQQKEYNKLFVLMAFLRFNLIKNVNNANKYV